MYCALNLYYIIIIIIILPRYYEINVRVLADRLYSCSSRVAGKGILQLDLNLKNMPRVHVGQV